MLSSKNKEKIYIKCIESIKSTSESNKLKFISKLLFESFESWIFCGFYFQENDKLLVSEYCANKIPCSPIEFNGVCGTAILKNKILNIKDVNNDERIRFIAGCHGLDALEKKVNANPDSVAFSIFPSEITDVIKVADNNLTMPPKSTWFDPKPLDGLVVYEFE